jgi:two-component system chemotaxis response regulator CheY
MKTLVVDDELTTRIALLEMLSQYGEVASCVDGSEAVLAHKRALECGSPYDLICMDIFMSNMSGLEAMKLIRQEEQIHGRFRQRLAKIIITTGADDEDTINHAFRGLCDAYIIKPIDADELIGIVQCLFPVEECSR